MYILLSTIYPESAKTMKFHIKEVKPQQTSVGVQLISRQVSMFYELPSTSVLCLQQWR